MPPAIAALADRMLTRPEKVVVSPPASTVDEVDQRVHFVARDRKPSLLADLLRDPAARRALVFTRTKRGADRVARWLVQDGIQAEAIHGNKSQSVRERSLKSFRIGRTRVLVATDIAARGLDIDGITHVINYELPNVPESYVHRIGRTARAGARGIAISLCDPEERAHLREIEKRIRRSVSVAAVPSTPRSASKVSRPQSERSPAEPPPAEPPGADSSSRRKTQRKPRRGGWSPPPVEQRGRRRRPANSRAFSRERRGSSAGTSRSSR
jgi:ATP-dependent RNA helicase RhlE